MCLFILMIDYPFPVRTAIMTELFHLQGLFPLSGGPQHAVDGQSEPSSHHAQGVSSPDIDQVGLPDLSRSSQDPPSQGYIARQHSGMPGCGVM